MQKFNTSIKEISSKLFNFSDKILNFTENFEKIQNKYPEIICLTLYPILFLITTCFHEPWFDEAQAWQIAKCASYHDILFYLPHFEGHPPLWHLILSIFAKNNFPYEATIKTISFIFSYLAMALIVLKSPFKRLIRVLIPFTYFPFYQYGIISRPYCITMFVFVLAAILFKKRNEKPARYLACLIILSLTHVYCFVISFFLCAVWFFENLKNKKVFICGIIFIIFSILLTLEIIPDSNVHALLLDQEMSLLKRLIYTLFIMPSDGLITNICLCIVSDSFSKTTMFFGLYLNLFFWCFLYKYTKNETFKLFLIPFIPLAICASKYISLQHIGIITFFIIFISWITYYFQSEKEELSKDFKKCFILYIFAIFVIQIWWTFKSSLLDIYFTYSEGRKEAAFIKEHHLDNYKILSGWTETENKTTKKEKINTNINGTLLTLAPYFDKKIYYNFMHKDPSINYVIHKELSNEESLRTIEEWKTMGLPDVIIGNVTSKRLFKKDELENYIIVYWNNSSYIIKGILLGEGHMTIRVRKDLAKELNLKKVEPDIMYERTSLDRIVDLIACKILEKDFFNRRTK